MSVVVKRTVASVKRGISKDKKRIGISTGCTLLNLACSDKPGRAFTTGTMINLVGASFAGKTVIAESILAEACYNPKFDKYRLYEDSPEFSDGTRKLFGSKFLARVKPPVLTRAIKNKKTGKKEQRMIECSETIEDLRDNFLNALDTGEACFYDLDSLDALTSRDEQVKAKEIRSANVSGSDISGSMKMERAKILTETLRLCYSKIHHSDSFVIIVSQVRANVQRISFMQDKYQRAGAEALKHFCSHEVWFTLCEKIKKKGVSVGVWTKATIKKNRSTGKDRTVYFPILFDYGIDDIRANINYLCDMKIWTGDTKINTGEFAGTLKEDELIDYIEREHKERDLVNLVSSTWMEFEDSIKSNRVPRYA